MSSTGISQKYFFLSDSPFTWYSQDTVRVQLCAVQTSKTQILSEFSVRRRSSAGIRVLRRLQPSHVTQYHRQQAALPRYPLVPLPLVLAGEVARGVGGGVGDGKPVVLQFSATVRLGRCLGWEGYTVTVCHASSGNRMSAGLSSTILLDCNELR